MHLVGSPLDDKSANALEQMECNVHGVRLHSSTNAEGRRSLQTTLLSSATTEDGHDKITALPQVVMKTEGQLHPRQENQRFGVSV